MSEETVHVVTDLPAKSSHPQVRKFATVAVLGAIAATAAVVAWNRSKAQPASVETTETSEN